MRSFHLNLSARLSDITRISWYAKQLTFTVKTAIISIKSVLTHSLHLHCLNPYQLIIDKCGQRTDNTITERVIDLKIRKKALLLSLCAFLTLSTAALPYSNYTADHTLTAEAALSKVFVDIDGNEHTLGDGTPAVVVYGRPGCFNTRTTLTDIISSGWLSSGDIRIIFADIDGNDIGTVSVFRTELGSDSVFYCSDDNRIGSSYGSRMYSDLGISGCVTLPVIGYYNGSGELLASTTGLQTAADVYTAVMSEAPPEAVTEPPTESPAVPYDAASDYTYELQEDGTVCITKYNGNKSVVDIPSEIDGKPVTRLGKSAFEYSMSDIFEVELTSVTIPDTVKYIEESCFWHQKKLAAVNAPETLEFIGPYAFNITSWLDTQSRNTDVVYLSGIVIVGMHCGENVTIADGTKAIAGGAFVESYCRNIYIPASVSYIGENAFSGLDDLTVYCEEGSYAETYAKENGFTVSIGSDLPENEPIKDHEIEPFLMWDEGGELVQNDDGTFTFVQFSSYSPFWQDGIVISRLDPATGTLSFVKGLDKRDEEIGSVFLGEDYNFILCGNDNYSESDDAIVLRLSKYSKSWDHVADLLIKGDNTYEPFQAGDISMAEYDGRLFIHTAHTMYSIGGVHHQANLTYLIDEETMSVKDKNCYVSASDLYVSHSFSQSVAADKDGAFFADLGDAYPRAVVLQKTGLNGISSASFSSSLMNITGSTGDNRTGVVLGNIVLTEKNVLTPFASVEQVSGNSFNGPKDLYIAVSDKGNGKTTLHKIMEYSKSEKNSTYYINAFIRAGSRNILFWSASDCEYEKNGSKNPDYTDGVHRYCAVISDEGEIVGSITELNDTLKGGLCYSEKDGIIYSAYADDTDNDRITEVTVYTFDPASMQVTAADRYITEAAMNKKNKGDLNGDGLIDALDASMILVHYAGISTGGSGELDDTQKKSADVNDDSMIDSSDASDILAYYAYTSTAAEEAKTFYEFLATE